MSIEHPLFELEQRLGYRFRNLENATMALTHSSKSGSNNNERLEFLGDRVLNLVIAHALFDQFPAEPEGSLAKRHAALVQGKMLTLVARDMHLGEYMILSDGERLSGGADNDNILSDAMEAILAAIYLDGGLEAVRGVIARLWDKHLLSAASETLDPKTELQEWVQGRGLPLPSYEIVNKTGPDHAPRFEIEVRVKGFDPAIAEGPSRRHAEKEAARIMLSRIKAGA